jgi:AcrR family transcriptional regulator
MALTGGSSYSEQASGVFRRLPEKKRETVFGAAVEELALHGYGGASLNRLVKRAGISKGSIFQYFGSKLGLFRSVGDYAAESVREYLRKVRDESADLPLPERVMALADAGFAFIDDNPMLARVFFNVLMRGAGAEGEEQVSRLREEGRRFLAGLLDDAAVKGEIPSNLDTQTAGGVLYLVLEDMLRERFTKANAPGIPESENSTRQRIEIMMNGMLSRD